MTNSTAQTADPWDSLTELDLKGLTVALKIPQGQSLVLRNLNAHLSMKQELSIQCLKVKLHIYKPA
jgi:hypothetical protein